VIGGPVEFDACGQHAPQRIGQQGAGRITG
jgi:hypothetical protein